jgi:2-dehydro-3-deoxyglucarate aldolase
MRSQPSSQDISYGSWVHIGHPAMAELMASLGFDWLAVDLEHGAVDISQSLSLIQAIKGQGVVPYARLPYNDLIWIRRALDTGYMGLVIPMVNTAEEAARAVNVAKYPPIGQRGIGFCPANMYGTRVDDMIAKSNRDIKIIAQVETAASVENVQAILEVEGIDGVFMGPYDLSGSYGVLGQFDHPLMKSAYEKVLSACERTGKLAGIHVVAPDLDQVRQRAAQGFRFIALSLDITLIATYGRALIDGAREIQAEVGRGSQ